MSAKLDMTRHIPAITQMRREGMFCNAIAKSLGYGSSVIRRVLSELNMSTDDTVQRPVQRIVIPTECLIDRALAAPIGSQTTMENVRLAIARREAMYD